MANDRTACPTLGERHNRPAADSYAGAVGIRRTLSGGSAKLPRIGVLGVISVVAGLLLGGMLLPIVGGVGLLARTGANDFERLPSELDISAPPQVSRILAADGSTLATFYFQDRIVVGLDQIPQVMQKAIVAVEDVRFYEHHGIDVKGAFRALLHNGSSGSVQQGGSTLTQQYVKNVLIENAQTKGDKAAVAAAHSDTLARKAREARYAIALEQKYSKAQILAGYLNIAYFGDGAYGVGTAAKHYFGKSVRKLTLPQAALLAGLVQSPEVYDPALHPVAARARRDVVLGQMLKYHFIDQTQFDRATAKPVALHVRRQGNGCEASSAPYFCDYVQHVIETSKSFGATKADRVKLLLRGGLTIHTTLDQQVQQAADAAVRNYVHPRDPSGVAGAETVVQPGTGKVLAISVSRPYGQDAKRGQNTIDYAVDQKYGGGQFGYPAGSTFKLFVLAAALKEGIPLSTTIYAPPSTTITGLTNCAGLPVSPWPVHNAGDSEAGRFNLVTGTWFSVNTFFAQLEQRTGLCTPVKIAESMGVRQNDGAPPEQIGPFTLGAAHSGYTTLDIANAYATIAAHGRYCPPTAISKVTDQNGGSISVPKPSCKQVLDPGLADTVTSILRGVLTQRGATAAGVGEPGRPAAAKTGTADNNVASNFAGFVPQMAAAVWVGDPTKAASRSLNGLTIGGRPYGEVFGATIAGPIWRDTLTSALEGEPVIQLPAPDSQFVNGITKPVPDVSGLSLPDATNVLEQAGFKVSVAAQREDSDFPQDTVARTNPPAGGGAPPGGTVVVYLSTGHVPTTKPGQQPPGRPPGSTAASPATTPTPTCTPKGHGHGPPHC
jgi:membrane peptidoglycan carboxypeptidase